MRLGRCVCSGKHVPDPRITMELDMRGETVYLCPTSAANLMLLIEEYRRAGGSPDGSTTKHFGPYIRRLAKEIIEEGNSEGQGEGIS